LWFSNVQAVYFYAHQEVWMYAWVDEATDIVIQADEPFSWDVHVKVFIEDENYDSILQDEFDVSFSEADAGKKRITYRFQKMGYYHWEMYLPDQEENVGYESFYVSRWCQEGEREYDDPCRRKPFVTISSPLHGNSISSWEDILVQGNTWEGYSILVFVDWDGRDWEHMQYCWEEDDDDEEYAEYTKNCNTRYTYSNDDGNFSLRLSGLADGSHTIIAGICSEWCIALSEVTHFTVGQTQETIDIRSPDQDSILSENVEISIWWVTSALHHDVKIMLNNTEIGTTKSDDSWYYTLDIEHLKRGKYTVVAQLLWPNGNTLQTSEPIDFSVGSHWTQIRNTFFFSRIFLWRVWSEGRRLQWCVRSRHNRIQCDEYSDGNDCRNTCDTFSCEYCIYREKT